MLCALVPAVPVLLLLLFIVYCLLFIIIIIPVARPLPVPTLPPRVGKGVGAGQVHGACVAGALLLLLLLRAVEQQLT